MWPVLCAGGQPTSWEDRAEERASAGAEGVELQQAQLVAARPALICPMTCLLALSLPSLSTRPVPLFTLPWPPPCVCCRWAGCTTTPRTRTWGSSS